MKHVLKVFMVLIALLFTAGSILAATYTGPSASSAKNRSSSSSSRTRKSTTRHSSTRSVRSSRNRSRPTRNRSRNRSSSSGTKLSSLGVKLDSSSDFMTEHAESMFIGYYDPSVERNVLKRAEDHARDMVRKEGMEEK